MDRRFFLKKSILGLGSFLLASSFGALSSMASIVIKASEGKLGYKTESRFPNKNCLNCKSYKSRENEEFGECILGAMKNVMKADMVLVDKSGHCNMWSKII